MISIFAKPAFLNTSNSPFISKRVSYKGNGHMMRVSSIIRADQIAKKLKARLNPLSDYEKDVCIYIKPNIKKGNIDFKFEGKPYLDIIDGWGLLTMLENNPTVPVIACSKQDQFILSGILSNRILLIPQHHCNFKREKRIRKKIVNIGIIGTEDAFAHLPEDLEKKLNENGFKLIKYSKFFSRMDIVRFYRQIDVQLIWRPYRMRLSNPLKIVNAASFGIPTIAYRESVFEEMNGCYIPVSTVDEVLTHLSTLRSSKTYYNTFSNMCLKKSEAYHIDNISKLYKQL